MSIEQKNKAVLVSRMLDWFLANARDLPWRRTRDPYAVWISEIMLQQTQVKTVIPYWERWMRELPTVGHLAAAPQEKVLKLWEGLGYYTRVRNMQKAAQLVVTHHNGCFPATFEDVLALPGIGRYTAGAICSIAFNQPTPILDGNVIRVLTRVFGIAENPRDKTTNERLWKLADDLVTDARACKVANKPSPFAPLEDIPACSFLNQSLMELGALVCAPRQPRCDVCPVRSQCIAHRDQRVEELPNLEKRAAATYRRFVAFVIERDGRFLVRQRPVGVVNASLWEFPNVEMTAGEKLDKTVRAFGVADISKEPLCTIKHSITRYRISLEAYRARPVKRARATASSEDWRTVKELEQLAFPSAHRKILEALLALQTNKFYPLA